MTWPFRNRSDDAQTIRALSQERDQAEDAYTNLIQQIGAAEIAMKAMQKPLTEAGLAEIAKDTTAQIADIYARGWPSVHARDNAVSEVIRSTVLKATRGEKDARL